MAKQGKRAIPIPEGVQVSLQGETVNLSGPAGSLTMVLPPLLGLKIGDGAVSVYFTSSERSEDLRGLYHSLIKSRLHSVQKGVVKRLEVVGVGYQAEVRGKELVLKVGFSHPVVLPIPEGVTVKVEKSIITLSGVDPQKVGDFAAEIRRVRPPEPYSGKGIRYEGEYVRRKVGKAAGATK